MKNFRCDSCGLTVLFENTACGGCGHRLGFLPAQQDMSAVEADGDKWFALASPGDRYRFCANWEMHGCNWLTPASGRESYCVACRHNRTIPDLSDAERHSRWQKIETAKRRLFYSLIRLRLPLESIADNVAEPLVFDFLADPINGPKVVTGHDNGIITLSIAEADEGVRERNRLAMGEPYRTLLGHFRHEIGHYYWDRLVLDGGELDGFRHKFGDERADYGAALQRYYGNGAPADWQDSFISAYATSHPWEDFAETFAHYLHIVDTLETGRAMGISMRRSDGSNAAVDFDPYRSNDAPRLIETWLDLAFAVNNLNRSMGQPDLYPFVLSAKVADKIGFIQNLVQSFRAAAIPQPAPVE